MITSIFDEIKLIRRVKRGVWVKTKKRGWITLGLYKEYLGYAFDPIVIKCENYEKR